MREEGDGELAALHKIGSGEMNESVFKSTEVFYL